MDESHPALRFTRTRPDRAGFSLVDIRPSGAAARCLLSFFDPRFHFGQVPHDAARRQVEATRELAAALHFVDRRFGQGDDLPQFLAADGATEGKGAALRKLRQCLIGFRARQGKGLIGVDAGVNRPVF